MGRRGGGGGGGGRGAGGVKARGLERRAIVDVVGLGQPEGREQPPEAEAQGGVVLVEEIAPLGDEAAEVVDVGAEQGPPQRAVRGADVGPGGEVRDDELEGRRGRDPAEGLLPETPQGVPGEALRRQVAVQGRARDRAARDRLLPGGNVDDWLPGGGGGV